MEVSVDAENASKEGNTSSGESLYPQPKKAKLLADLNIVHEFLSSSPDLPHKLLSRQHQESEDSEDSREHSNMFGVNFVM